MQIISEDKINEIRNSADIVNIIADYIPLKSEGKNYFGVCPFHDDHSPSMSVSPERQLFKCFVCNKGGNVFTFVKDYENISYIEAVKKVADKVGIVLDYTPIKKQENKNKLEYEIVDFASKIFQNNLNSKKGSNAKKYLEERNITDDIIKDFKIGFALDDSTYLYNVLSKKNYDIAKLDELGLITKDGINGYDKFVNRIMIPISDLDGHVVGFTGRIFNGEDSAKYINTKETSIYKKGSILFNYSNALPHIRENKEVVVVEGNMDAIRMYSCGIRNVLALMGTALTKEQVNILKKLRVPVVLMLDSDGAGELATVNIGNYLTESGITCKVVRLNGAKDPDEYIVKYGVEKFLDTIKHSLNYFDYRLSNLKENKNLDNTEELISYVKAVLKMVEKSDNLTKEITLKKLSTEYNLDYEMLKKELNFTEEKKNYKFVSSEKKRDKYQICVHNILYYMMSDAKYLNIYNKKLGFLKNAEERNLVTEIEYYINKYGKINMADFISYAENDYKIKDLVNHINGSVYIEELNDKLFLDYLQSLNKMLERDNINKIREKINQSTDINEQLENINRQIAMAKKMLESKKEV